MWVEASAPSNIALIKYMGKLDSTLNTPCNTSLSYTLEHLRTFVRVKKSEQSLDTWSALKRSDLRPIELSLKGKEKFLHFFSKLKIHFKIVGFFQIESANNFPSDCGLASSASSFAALTMAAYTWASKHNSHLPIRTEQLAQISKQGSGSSCRSFFAPWSIWDETTVKKIEFPLGNLLHQVILCDESVKLVSSSQAHKLVLTSDLFMGRPVRAESRFKDLVQSLQSTQSAQSTQSTQWKLAFNICWNEFWDMHGLFHTANPAFMYMNGHSQNVLQQILLQWQANDDGPLVTMDAGSNVHLLYRQDQVADYQKMILQFNTNYAMWTDEGYRARK